MLSVAALPPSAGAQVASGCISGFVRLWSIEGPANTPVRTLRVHAANERSVRAMLYLPAAFEEVDCWHRDPEPAAAASRVAAALSAAAAAADAA